MGQNKALLTLNGERRQVRADANPGGYENAGLTIVYDDNSDIGPIEGIRQVLLHAREDHCFLCAADMPLLKRELVSYLASYISSDYDCFLLTEGGRPHPLCSIYSRRMLPAVEAQIREGSFRLRDLPGRVRTQDIPLEYSGFDRHVVFNVNTPEDFARLEKSQL